MENTLLWYDLETFGRHPGWDRVAQFAAVRTTEDLLLVGDPIVLYCRITPDYLPDPHSCLITGITPQEVLAKGVSEYEFIREIDKEFSRPMTCVVGYNNIRFDDEFVRNLYYRNFFDPYLREWSGHNSRWDLINLVRMTADLRPEGIFWPAKKEGGKSFALAALAEENDLVRERAHDALSDVWTTLELARLIKETQPRLYNHLYTVRRKEEVRKRIKIGEPLLHTSAMFRSERGNTAIVLPLTVDAKNRNCLISFDLSCDPAPLLSLSVSEIRKRVFSPRDALEGVERIPLKGICVNKCPAIAPMSAIDQETADRMGWDLATIEKNRKMLIKEGDLGKKVRRVTMGQGQEKIDDVDLQIYTGGFFLDEDRREFDRIHKSAPQELPSLRLDCRDARVSEMLRRFIGRNFPEVLGSKEHKAWKSFCASRLLFSPGIDVTDWGLFQKRLKSYQASTESTASEKRIVRQLVEYGERINREILT